MNTVQIPLTGDVFAIIDECDYEKVVAHAWKPLKTRIGKFYVMRMKRENGRSETVYLHRFLMGLEKGNKTCVDHVDGNGLNNSRSNIRLCNPSQNGANRKTTRIRPKSSSYRGVYVSGDRWKAEIIVDYSKKYLGIYEDERIAAIAYNEAARRYFGPFAFQNDVFVEGIVG